MYRLGRAGVGALKPESARHILLQDRRFRALIARCANDITTQDRLLVFLQHLWENEACRLHVAEWIFQRPHINVPLGRAVITLIKDYWIHEVMCSRTDLPDSVIELCKKSPYRSVVRAVDDANAGQRVRAALHTRRKHLIKDGGAARDKDDSVYLRRAQHIGIFQRDPRTGSQLGLPATGPSQEQPARTKSAVDFSVKDLRMIAADPSTPKHTLLWMVNPKFQPYLGLELSRNLASGKDVLLKLLRYRTLDKRIWRKVLVNIAKHPSADHEVLRALLALGPPGVILSEIAKREDINEQIAREVLSQSNSPKVLKLIRKRFSNLV